MRRTRGREVALQTLYQKELNPGLGARHLNTFLRRRLKQTPSLVDYAKALVEGVEAHKAELDARIQAVAENWRLDRMPALDRNVLRIGLYEIQTGGENTPPPVALDEAVELAKRYGTAQSSKFINGLLDRFLPGHPAAFKLGDPLPEPARKPEAESAPADGKPEAAEKPEYKPTPAATPAPTSSGLKRRKPAPKNPAE